MQAYKKQIIEALQKAITELYAGRLAYHEITESGLYCDFDIPEPLNPSKIDEIRSWLYGAGKAGSQAAPVVNCAYEISGFSGAYQDGDASKKMLQRIYVAAFDTSAELSAYKEGMSRAAERDHKKIGQQLGLFAISGDIGQGLVLWRPRGAMIRFLLEQFSQAAHLLNGYQWAYTPHIGRSELWKISGHLENFRDSMYSPISIDGEEYYLKPMNCPFHFTIYNSETRSYRDLPIRMAEFGTVYRYELSGTLNGLTRVRGFTQDDAHIICTPEQVEGEVACVKIFSVYPAFIRV